MPHETESGIGGQARELQAELLARDVLVGIDVERDAQWRERTEQRHVGLAEQCGTGDGDGLVAAGEHGPAVAGSLGDVERVALAEPPEDGQVVDVAGVAVGKLESGCG